MSMVLRAFIAAYPTPEALDRILAFRRELLDRLPRSGFRWANEEQLHLTLRFFGSFPLEKVAPFVETLSEGLAESEPFSLKASYVGSLWDRCKVLGLKVDGGGLEGLVVAVSRAASEHGLIGDKKEFRGHLTLARMDDPRLLPSIGKRFVCEWWVDSVYFVKSELQSRGAKHTFLAKIPLGSGCQR